MGNSLSIWASIAVEALACSGRLLPVVHPTIPARINAPAAMAAKLVLRICSLLGLVRTYDRSSTALADDALAFKSVPIGFSTAACSQRTLSAARRGVNAFSKN